MHRQDTWCRSAGVALVHQYSMMSCHGSHVANHMLRNTTFHFMQWMSR